MSHALVIATKELREKGRIFTLAVILAVLPFLASQVPAMRGWGKPMIIAFFGGMIGIALGLALAIGQGSTVIGRELSERRLSFYFTKPVSPAAVWFGKALAGIFTALACFAIITVPAFIVAGDVWGTAWTVTRAELIGVVAMAVVALFLVSHALSTMVRSRSALLGLDLALLVASGFALSAMIRPLLQGNALQVVLWLGAAMGIGLTILLATAPVWQLAKGRTDLRRNHVALSRVVWIGVAALMLVAGSYTWWVTHPSPSDIVRGSVGQAPGGQWLHAEGETRNRADYSAGFLYDTKSGKHLRMPLAWYGATFSADGRTVVLISGDVARPQKLDERTVYLAKLDEANPQLRATRMPAGRATVLSDDGKRMVTIERGMISVHDVERESMLVSARGLQDRAAHAMMFVGPGLVRIWQHATPAKGVEIFELDVARKSLTKTGEAEANVRYDGLTASADGSRVLLGESGLVIDGRTGATLQRFARTTRLGTAFLRDGRMVIAERGAKVHVLDAQGAVVRTIALPAAKYVKTGAELPGGRIAVTTSDEIPARYTTYIVDVNRGAIEHRIEGYAASHPWYSADPRTPSLGEGVPLAVYGRERGIRLWDVRSGSAKTL